MVMKTALIPIALCLFAASVAASVLVEGKGATFPSVVYSSWFSAYSVLEPGVIMSYNSSGSGEGKKAILSRLVDWGASDSSLSAEEFGNNTDIQMLPMLAGAVVPFYNIPEVPQNQNLLLTATLLTEIFTGVLQRWNDPRIQALNPGFDLPDAAIKIVFRSDKSGTTNTFTSALTSFNSSIWTYGASEVWPADLAKKDSYISAPGNEGTYSAVQTNPYSITYLSYSFIYQSAFQRNQYATLINKAGKKVKALSANVEAASRNASFNSHFVGSIVNSPDPDAWPISGFTYVVIYLNSTKGASACEKLRATVDFFRWAQEDYVADLIVRSLGFAPISRDIKETFFSVLDTVECDGDPLNDVSLSFPLETTVIESYWANSGGKGGSPSSNNSSGSTSFLSSSSLSLFLFSFFSLSLFLFVSP